MPSFSRRTIDGYSSTTHAFQCSGSYRSANANDHASFVLLEAVVSARAKSVTAAVPTSIHVIDDGAASADGVAAAAIDRTPS